MKLRPEQLTKKLKSGDAIAGIYLVFGEEPLLVIECADEIRSAARQAGYSLRDIVTVEQGFDWSSLAQINASGSLFGDRRIIDLRLAQHKAGDAGGKALIGYCDQPNPDNVLLITAGKLDSRMQRSRWFTTVEKNAVVIPTWPPKPDQLPEWIRSRSKRLGLTLDRESCALLAERVEGNLLAAAQEIDKLALLFDGREISVEPLRAVIGDSARYDVFDLTDAALQGDLNRANRILTGLRTEGTEPVLVLWSLMREIRLLNALHEARRRGLPIATALTEHSVWGARKPLIIQAVKRLPARRCGQLLQACARLDRLLKGQPDDGPTRPWDELLMVTRRLAQMPA